MQRLLNSAGLVTSSSKQGKQGLSQGQKPQTQQRNFNFINRSSPSPQAQMQNQALFDIDDRISDRDSSNHDCIFSCGHSKKPSFNITTSDLSRVYNQNLAADYKKSQSSKANLTASAQEISQVILRNKLQTKPKQLEEMFRNTSKNYFLEGSTSRAGVTSGGLMAFGPPKATSHTQSYDQPSQTNYSINSAHQWKLQCNQQIKKQAFLIRIDKKQCFDDEAIAYNSLTSYKKDRCSSDSLSSIASSSSGNSPVCGKPQHISKTVDHHHQSQIQTAFPGGIKTKLVRQGVVSEDYQTTSVPITATQYQQRNTQLAKASLSTSGTCQQRHPFQSTQNNQTMATNARQMILSQGSLASSSRQVTRKGRINQENQEPSSLRISLSPLQRNTAMVCKRQTTFGGLRHFMDSHPKMQDQTKMPEAKKLPDDSDNDTINSIDMSRSFTLQVNQLQPTTITSVALTSVPDLTNKPLPHSQKERMAKKEAKIGSQKAEDSKTKATSEQDESGLKLFSFNAGAALESHRSLQSQLTSTALNHLNMIHLMQAESNMFHQTRQSESSQKRARWDLSGGKQTTLKGSVVVKPSEQSDEKQAYQHTRKKDQGLSPTEEQNQFQILQQQYLAIKKQLEEVQGFPITSQTKGQRQKSNQQKKQRQSCERRVDVLTPDMLSPGNNEESVDADNKSCFRSEGSNFSSSREVTVQKRKVSVHIDEKQKMRSRRKKSLSGGGVAGTLNHFKSVDAQCPSSTHNMLRKQVSPSITDTNGRQRDMLSLKIAAQPEHRRQETMVKKCKSRDSLNNHLNAMKSQLQMGLRKLSISKQCLEQEILNQKQTLKKQQHQHRRQKSGNERTYSQPTAKQHCHFRQKSSLNSHCTQNSSNSSGESYYKECLSQIKQQAHPCMKSRKSSGSTRYYLAKDSDSICSCYQEEEEGNQSPVDCRSSLPHKKSRSKGQAQKQSSKQTKNSVLQALNQHNHNHQKQTSTSYKDLPLASRDQSSKQVHHRKKTRQSQRYEDDISQNNAKKQHHHRKTQSKIIEQFSEEDDIKHPNRRDSRNKYAASKKDVEQRRHSKNKEECQDLKKKRKDSKSRHRQSQERSRLSDLPLQSNQNHQIFYNGSQTMQYGPGGKSSWCMPMQSAPHHLEYGAMMPPGQQQTINYAQNLAQPQLIQTTSTGYPYFLPTHLLNTSTATATAVVYPPPQIQIANPITQPIFPITSTGAFSQPLSNFNTFQRTAAINVGSSPSDQYYYNQQQQQKVQLSGTDIQALECHREQIETIEHLIKQAKHKLDVNLSNSSQIQCSRRGDKIGQNPSSQMEQLYNRMVKSDLNMHKMGGSRNEYLKNGMGASSTYHSNQENLLGGGPNNMLFNTQFTQISEFSAGGGTGENERPNLQDQLELFNRHLKESDRKQKSGSKGFELSSNEKSKYHFQGSSKEERNVAASDGVGLPNELRPMRDSTNNLHSGVTKHYINDSSKIRASKASNIVAAIAGLKVSKNHDVPQYSTTFNQSMSSIANAMVSATQDACSTENGCGIYGEYRQYEQSQQQLKTAATCEKQMKAQAKENYTQDLHSNLTTATNTNKNIKGGQLSSPIDVDLKTQVPSEKDSKQQNEQDRETLLWIDFGDGNDSKKQPKKKPNLTSSNSRPDSSLQKQRQQSREHLHKISQTQANIIPEVRAEEEMCSPGDRKLIQASKKVERQVSDLSMHGCVDKIKDNSAMCFPQKESWAMDFSNNEDVSSKSEASKQKRLALENRLKKRVNPEQITAKCGEKREFTKEELLERKKELLKNARLQIQQQQQQVTQSQVSSIEPTVDSDNLVKTSTHTTTQVVKIDIIASKGGSKVSSNSKARVGSGRGQEQSLRTSNSNSSIPLQLVSRLSSGHKTEITKKDMLKLTSKNYEQLPEIKRRKLEENKKEDLLKRIATVKELEKKRRQSVVSKRQKTQNGKQQPQLASQTNLLVEQSTIANATMREKPLTALATIDLKDTL